MPPGDLLTIDGEYQFKTQLWNGAAIEHDAGFMVRGVDGLFGTPELRVNDVARQADHGMISSQEYMGARVITLDLAVYGSSKADFHTKLKAAQSLFNPIAVEDAFAYQRNGEKRFVWARSRKLSLPTEDHGRWVAEGSAQLFCPDPRIYDVAEQVITAQINPGSNNVGLVLNNAGDMWTWARFEIDGPVTNPRIANSHDSNRQIKIDHVVTAGQLMEIDQAQLTVEVAGVDQFNSVRTDNQWIHIWPGNNNLTFSRSGTTGTSVIRAYFRSAWI